MEIRVRQTCPNCKGEGFVSHPGCKTCGSFFDSEINPADPFLPCGHSRMDFADEWPCLDCMSSGKVESWITVEEWIAKVQSIKSSST